MIFVKTLSLAILCLHFHFATASYDEDSDFSDPDQLTASAILQSHSTVQDAPERTQVQLNVFGFATPWNGRGKDIALRESEKGRLDILSPVTYQMTASVLQGGHDYTCLLYTSPSPRDQRGSRMPSSA